MPSPPQPRWFERPRTLFWIALAVRLLVILLGHTYRIRVREDHWEFGYEAGRLAAHLVRGQGYSSPFDAPSGPSAWLPPLYPLLVAACFKLFGVYSQLSAFVIMAADSVFSALTVPAVFELGRRLFDDHHLVRRHSRLLFPVATWSAWIFALHPETIQYPIHWIWEMSLSTCLFAWALVFTLRTGKLAHSQTGKLGSNPTALWAITGLLWGLVALSNTTLCIVFPFTTAWAIWPQLRRRQLLQPLLNVCLASLVIALVLLPWIIRNWLVFHAFVPTRSNFGIEFWNATRWQFGAFPWGSAVPRDTHTPEFQLFARMGELRYAALRHAQAVANIRANPGEYLRDTLLRLQFFWFIWPHPMDSKPISETFRLFNYGFISVCGLLGLVLAFTRRIAARWFLLWPMLLVPIPYYLVTVQARFRYPIEPLICVLAVYLFRSTTPRTSSNC